MVQEFLGRAGDGAPSASDGKSAPAGEQGLPPDVADELLADMGVGPDRKDAGAASEQA